MLKQGEITVGLCRYRRRLTTWQTSQGSKNAWLDEVEELGGCKCGYEDSASTNFSTSDVWVSVRSRVLWVASLFSTTRCGDISVLWDPEGRGAAGFEIGVTPSDLG